MPVVEEGLLIGGQNNHDWKKSTPLMRGILERAGNFRVAINNAPENNSPPSAWDAWQPRFKDFDCVVLDYNGQVWPETIKQEFVSYVASGGGVVVIHAANNSFGGWKEYEQMVGLLLAISLAIHSPTGIGLEANIDAQQQQVGMRLGRSRPVLAA